MTRIGITGGEGFVGSHLRFFLHEHKNDYQTVLIGREDFVDHKKLLDKLSLCDIIVHLAGLNRGDDDEQVYNTNISLTKTVISGLDEVKKTPKIIFLSSTHNTRDTGYGKSKRESEALIYKWGEKNKTATTSIVSTNIFGEFCKPHYNSVVATFSYELANMKESKVDQSATVSIEFIYVRDICSLIFDSFKSVSTQTTLNPKGRNIKIVDLYYLIKSFRDEYFSGIIPSFKDKFEISLFNTFRSYLYPQYFPVSLDLKTDNRGTFVEIAKERTGGQTSFSTTHPNQNIIRGNHYHTRKIERFCVISGEAVIKLRKLFSSEITEYKVSGEKPVYVDMPVYYTHSIENTGSTELLTMFWINEIFDPSDPDTFMENVVETK